MPTHLYPNHAPSYRTKFKFKPTFYTHQWQRPTDGDRTRPGSYEKPAQHLHLPTPEVPEIRGRCASTRALTERSVSSPQSSHRSNSASPSKRKGDSLYSSTSISRLGEKLESSAAVEDERAQTMIDTDINLRVGVAVTKTCNGRIAAVMDMVQKWDKNGKAQVNKPEFRMGVRASPPYGLGLGTTVHVADIDNLFDNLNNHKSGSLELDELRKALEKMMDHARKGLQEAETIRRSASKLRDQANFAKETFAATVEVEREEAQLVDMQRSLSVKEQLGRLIVKKNMKIADIVIKWDTEGSGEVLKVDFRTQLLRLGVLAEESAIDECFDSYDADGGGSLDLQEIKVALRELQSAAKYSHGAEDSLERSILRLRKFAKKQQNMLMIMTNGDLKRVAEEDRRQQAEKRKEQAAAVVEGAVDENAPGAAPAVARVRRASQGSIGADGAPASAPGAAPASAPASAPGAAPATAPAPAPVPASAEASVGSAEDAAAVDVSEKIDQEQSEALPPRAAAVEEAPAPSDDSVDDDATAAAPSPAPAAESDEAIDEVALKSIGDKEEASMEA